MRKLSFKSKWNTLLITTELTEMCLLQLDEICITITAVTLYLGCTKSMTIFSRTESC